MSNKIQTIEHIPLVIKATKGYSHTRLILISSNILHCKISSKIHLRPIVSDFFILTSYNYLNEPLFHPSSPSDFKPLENGSKQSDCHQQPHPLWPLFYLNQLQSEHYQRNQRVALLVNSHQLSYLVTSKDVIHKFEVREGSLKSRSSAKYDSYQLIGGGKLNYKKSGNYLPVDKWIYPDKTTKYGPILRAPLQEPLLASEPYWKPNNSLPYVKDSHPLEILIHESDLQLIKYYCAQDSHQVITYSSRKPTTAITTFTLRDLISHGQPITGEVMELCLEVLCTHFDLCYLTPHLIPLLARDGWERIKRYFSNHRSRNRRTTFRPNLKGEKAIAIPCHINGNHWAGVVR